MHERKLIEHKLVVIVLTVTAITKHMFPLSSYRKYRSVDLQDSV